MAAKRLTRKEMVRKDRIQQTLTETSSWLVRNLNYILGIAAIALLSVAVAYLWQSYQRSVQAELQTRFADALAKYHANIAEEEDAAKEDETPPIPQAKYEFSTVQERSENALSSFRELSEEYPGTRLGTLSTYYVGLTLVDLERPDEARSVLSSLIADSEHADITNLARNALAQLEASAGNHEEAVRLLNAILDEPSPNFPQQMVLTRLAESYEAIGDFEAALRIYRRISAEYTGSTYATKSDSRIEYLELRGVSVETEDPPTEAPK